MLDKFMRSATFAVALTALAPTGQATSAMLTTTPGAPMPEAADNTLGMALMGAYVFSTGTLQPVLSTGGVVSANRTGTGTYNVTFNRRLDGCTHVAMANSSSRTIQAHGPSGANRDTWIVTTRNLAGALADSAFSIINVCAK